MLPLTLAGKASRRGGERRASGQGCVAPLPEVPRLKHERSVGIWTCVLFLITSCESRKRLQTDPLGALAPELCTRAGAHGHSMF